MSASPGGYASKAEQAERAEKVKRLYADGLGLTAIAKRLGIHVTTAAVTASRLGLHRPDEREKK